MHLGMTGRFTIVHKAADLAETPGSFYYDYDPIRATTTSSSA